MLVEQVKSQRLEARKAKDTYASKMLTTLVGELETKAKNSGIETTDEDVLALIKSYIKKNKEALDKMEAESVGAKSLVQDNDFWGQFLPKQMSEEQLKALVKERVEAGDNMGSLMKFLNQNHKDQFEGKMVNILFRELSA